MTRPYDLLLSGLVLTGLLAAGLSWSGKAQAQQPSAPPPPVSTYPQQPPPAYPLAPGQRGEWTSPVAPPGYHLHDGFYLRMNLGLGSLKSTAKADGAGSGTVVFPETESSGTNVAFDIWLGGTPTPGAVVGVALIGNSVSEPKVKPTGGQEGTAKDQVMTQSLIGPMFDYFIDPKDGFHLGAMLGLGSLSWSYHPENSSTNTSRTSTGYGGALWAGYDAWVSDNWSLGGILRYAGTKTESDKNLHTEETSHAIALMLTGVYH